MAQVVPVHVLSVKENIPDYPFDKEDGNMTKDKLRDRPDAGAPLVSEGARIAREWLEQNRDWIGEGGDGDVESLVKSLLALAQCDHGSHLT